MKQQHVRGAQSVSTGVSTPVGSRHSLRCIHEHQRLQLLLGQTALLFNADVCLARR